MFRFRRPLSAKRSKLQQQIKFAVNCVLDTPTPCHAHPAQ